MLLKKHIHFILFFVVGNIYFILSNYALILFYLKGPSNSIFPLYHTYSWFDYNTYLSVITQGKYGLWLMRDAFTTEPTNPTLFYFFYIIVGKFASFFHFESYIAYHIARFIGIELFLMSLFICSRKILGTKGGFWASILTIVMTIPPILFFDEPQAGKEYTPWWASLESLKRLDTMPHYIFGYSFLLICITGVLYYFSSRKKVYALFSIVSAFVCSIIFPPSVLPIVIGLPVAYVLHYRSKIFVKSNMRHLSFLSSIVFVSMIGMMFIWRENTNGFPWDVWNLFEVRTYNNASTDRGMLVVFSIFPYIALLSIFRIVQNKRFDLLWLCIWGCIPALTLATGILQISKYRLITTAPFIAYALLTIYVLFEIVPKTFLARYKYVLLFIIICSQMYLTFASLPSKFADVEHFPIYRIMFIPQKNWEGVTFVQDHIPIGSHILSDQYNGSILPAHAPIYSYVGHFVHTKDHERKLSEIRNFFAGSMSEQLAKNILQEGKIDYVYFGYDEKEYGKSSLSYSFLKSVFNNGEVEIYKVSYD